MTDKKEDSETKILVDYGFELPNIKLIKQEMRINSLKIVSMEDNNYIKDETGTASTFMEISKNPKYMTDKEKQNFENKKLSNSGNKEGINSNGDKPRIMVNNNIDQIEEIFIVDNTKISPQVSIIRLMNYLLHLQKNGYFYYNTRSKSISINPREQTLLLKYLQEKNIMLEGQNKILEEKCNSLEERIKSLEKELI